MSTFYPTQARGPDSQRSTTAPPQLIIRFVGADAVPLAQSGAQSVVQFVWNGAGGAPSQVTYPWNAWSVFSGHPAALPPLPRAAKAEQLAEAFPTTSSPSIPARAVAPLLSTPSQPHAYPVRARHTQSAVARPLTGMNDRAPLFTPRDALEVATEARRAIARRPVAARAATHTSLHSTHNRTSQHSAYGEHNAQIAPTPAAHSPRAIENLAWPSSFDDWMIDIVRRRALRLNSGARRRGALGSVRAVELGHILDNSKDEKGRWLCAICDTPVTLQDLSFDHIVALADGGEHAAHNLAPAHRKCNEIKGSEKAQYRAKALDRWLSEWATTHEGALPKGATRYPSHGPVTPTDEERRYA